MRKSGVNAKASSRWLKEGKLGARMEARVVAAQDGVTRTRAYEVTKYIVPQTQLNHCCTLPIEENPAEQAG